MYGYAACARDNDDFAVQSISMPAQHIFQHIDESVSRCLGTDRGTSERGAFSCQGAAVEPASLLYCPKRKPISREPAPISPAGISRSSPIYLNSSDMKLWQKAIISRSDFPLRSKLEPPLAPPMGRPVKAFLKVCSNPRNFKRFRFTEEWKRSPPL